MMRVIEGELYILPEKRISLAVTGDNILYNLIVAKLLSDKGHCVTIFQLPGLSNGMNKVVSNPKYTPLLNYVGVDFLPTESSLEAKIFTLVKSISKDKVTYYSTKYKIADLKKQSGIKLGVRYIPKRQIESIESIAIKKLGTTCWLENAITPTIFLTNSMSIKNMILTTPTSVFHGLETQINTDGEVCFKSHVKGIHLGYDAKYQHNVSADEVFMQRKLVDFLKELKNIESLIL